MKRLQPVIWMKGTFLSPHHLQTQDRYLESTLRFQLEALNFTPWGFKSLQVNHEALTAGTLGSQTRAGVPGRAGVRYAGRGSAAPSQAAGGLL